MSDHNYAHGTNEILKAAQAYAAAGLCVIPICIDGSKQPALKTWKEFKERIPTPSEITEWFNNKKVGIGLLGGRVSRDLLQLDIDLDSIIVAFEEVLKDAGHGDLLQKLHKVKSPCGAHYRARVPGVHLPSLQLAWHSPDGQDNDQKILIETRNEGACAIVPPSPASCHPSGLLYATEHGDLTCLQSITEAEVQALYSTARLFGEPKRQKQNEGFKPAETPKNVGQRPGDLWAAQTSWQDFMESLGFVHVRTTGSGNLWRRPGKTEGTSAITGGNNDHLWVYSTSTVFDANRSYTKIGAYAHVYHAGSCSAAAKELHSRGYNSKNRQWARADGKEEQSQTETETPSASTCSPSGVQDAAQIAHIPWSVQNELADLPVEITATGLVVSPNATVAERKQVLHQLLRLTNWTQVWSKFAIGDAYNALPDAWGERKAWVTKNFGEGQYESIKNMGWTASRWEQHRRNLNLSWCFLTELSSKCFNVKDQDELVARWFAGGLTIKKIRAMKAEQKQKSSEGPQETPGDGKGDKDSLKLLSDDAREDLSYLLSHAGADYVHEMLRRERTRIGAGPKPSARRDVADPTKENSNAEESAEQAADDLDEAIFESDGCDEDHYEGDVYRDDADEDDFDESTFSDLNGSSNDLADDLAGKFRHDVMTQTPPDPTACAINTGKSTGLYCRDETACAESDETLRDASALLAPFSALLTANEAGLLPAVTVTLRPGTTIPAPHFDAINTVCIAIRRMAAFPMPPRRAMRERLAVLVALQDTLLPLIVKPPVQRD